MQPEVEKIFQLEKLHLEKYLNLEQEVHDSSFCSALSLRSGYQSVTDSRDPHHLLFKKKMPSFFVVCLIK